MKFILVILLASVGFSASAQWYRIDLKLKKKVVRPAAIQMAPSRAIARLPVIAINPQKITHYQLDNTDYNLQAQEAVVMKTAQHNMRFRVYNDASYNFSELAKLYIRQNRLSEAKWYLLQSNNISRSENDDRHTIANLLDLSFVKCGLGDYEQALQDLNEAHELAGIRGFRDDLATIDKKLLYLKQNKATMVKIDTKYADDAKVTAKADKKNL